MSSEPLVRINQKFGDWKVKKKLDEGGFGHVYLVENTRKKGYCAALKAEPNDVEGGSAIKLEFAVLMKVHKNGTKPHVPNVFYAAKHRRFCYMIVTLLGDNLRNLREKCHNGRMRPESWARVGIQCLYGLKVIHDTGFVHRDIKPGNFCLGQNDPTRARILHIIDFGLSRNFVIEKDGKLIARRARGSAEFRGTVRYVSPNVHDKYEQGRRDDVWSVMYMLIELHCGLPWQYERDKKKLEGIKLAVKDHVLVRNFPAEMHPIFPHLRALDCYNRPDYSMMHECLLKLMKSVNVRPDDPYEWEAPEEAAQLVAACGQPAPWENAKAFFASDPLKINGPPPVSATKQPSRYTTLSNAPTIEDNRDALDAASSAFQAPDSKASSRRTNLQ